MTGCLGFRIGDSGSAIWDFGFHIPQSAIRNPQWTGCLSRATTTTCLTVEAASSRLSSGQDAASPNGLALHDDHTSLDLGMTTRESLEQRRTGVSPVEGHGQGSPMPRLLRQFFVLRGLSPSGPPACHLLDTSRLWNNPVYPDYPVKTAPFTTPFILHPICESMH